MIDMDVDVNRSIDAFLKMGVLVSTDPANLDKGRPTTIVRARWLIAVKREL